MNHQYSDALRVAFADLCLRMQLPNLVAEFLLSAEKITPVDLSAVISQPTLFDKNAKLLDIVSSRDEDVFLAFREALLTPEINEKILVDQWFPNI